MMKEKAREFIKKCHVFPTVHALEGGVVKLESLLVDFCNEVKSYTEWNNSSDGVMALAACREFVRKVECGEARSRRSYAQMKAALDLFEKEQIEGSKAPQVIAHGKLEGMVKNIGEGDEVVWGADFGGTSYRSFLTGVLSDAKEGGKLTIIATITEQCKEDIS